MTISHTDGSAFIFDQVYLTSAWDELQNVTITGYNEGQAVGAFTTAINNDGPTFVDVDWQAIDTLVISHDGSNLVMDNFLFFV